MNCAGEKLHIMEHHFRTMGIEIDKIPIKPCVHRNEHSAVHPQPEAHERILPSTSTVRDMHCSEHFDFNPAVIDRKDFTRLMLEPLRAHHVKVVTEPKKTL